VLSSTLMVACVPILNFQCWTLEWCIFKVRYCECDVSALFYIGIGG
jgi:hypothetical protein